MNVPLSKKEKIKILNTEDLYAIMQQVLLREEKISRSKAAGKQGQEYFWVVGLTQEDHILFIELIHSGSVSSTTVEPMEVFSLSLQKGAFKIILCHHHPSGTLAPTTVDKDITDRLIQVGRIVNTPVIDHQIISPEGYVSFADTGLLQELHKSIKYVPSFEVTQRIQAEAQEIIKKGNAEAKARIELMEQAIEHERTRAEEAETKLKTVAKNLKEKGLALKTIAEVTGLALKDIEKL